MKIPSGLDGKRARVEIVPLLDVLLIVLIFLLYFALTSPQQRAIEIALPSGSGRPVSPAVTVSVTRDDRVLVAGNPVDRARVAEHIEAILRERGATDGRILLRSDRASSLGTTVAIVSQLAAAGYRDVSVEVNGQ